MRRKFAIIGLGRFGMRLARSLAAADEEVIAIDRNPKLVERIRDDVTLAVALDSTDIVALRSQGVDQVDVAVVGIGEGFESAALTVSVLSELGVPNIVARAQRDVQGNILKRIGADEIVRPESESADRWSHRLTLPNLKEYFELGEGYSMVYMVAPEMFHHKTLQELQLRNQHGVNLIAIKRPASDSEGGLASPAISVPEANTKILQGDVLVLVGSDDALDKLPDR